MQPQQPELSPRRGGDASWEPIVDAPLCLAVRAVARSGGVVFVPGRGPRAFSAPVPDWFLHGLCERDTQIALCEALAAVATTWSVLSMLVQEGSATRGTRRDGSHALKIQHGAWLGKPCIQVKSM